MDSDFLYLTFSTVGRLPSVLTGSGDNVDLVLTGREMGWNQEYVGIPNKGFRENNT